jgi:hypothetical protein
MTEIDDLELSLRLSALRVEPPANGFESRLSERLLEVVPDPVRPAGDGAPARVIMGPWLRRAPVRLIGATALLVAGAAAALEGGVVEWVQTRVLWAPFETPTVAPSAPPRSPPERRVERAVEPRPMPAVTLPEAVPTPSPLAERVALPRPSVPAPKASQDHADLPRLRPQRRDRTHSEAMRGSEIRPAAEPLAVPRVELTARSRAAGDSAKVRVGRGVPGAASELARERGRDLERIRDVARARRERASPGERPRLERLRERRERAAAERREGPSERARRERPIR